MRRFATTTSCASAAVALCLLAACGQTPPRSGAPKVYIPSVPAPQHAFPAGDIPLPKTKPGAPQDIAAPTPTGATVDPWRPLARTQLSLLSLDGEQARARLKALRAALQEAGAVRVPASFAVVEFAHAGDLHALYLPFDPAARRTQDVMAFVEEMRARGIEPGNIAIMRPTARPSREQMLQTATRALAMVDQEAATDPSYGQLTAENALDRQFEGLGMVEQHDPPNLLLGSYLSLAHAAYQARHDELGLAALEHARGSLERWRKRSGPTPAQVTSVERAIEQLDAALRQRQAGPLDRVRQGLQALLG